MFRRGSIQPTAVLAVVRSVDESTMRVLLSPCTSNDNNNRETPHEPHKSRRLSTQSDTTARSDSRSIEEEGSLEHVLAVMQTAENVHTLVFEWTGRPFLNEPQRAQLVQAATTIQGGILEIVFVTSPHDEDRRYMARNNVPAAALTHVLQSMPQLTRFKVGRGVWINGTREQVQQLAVAMARHTSLKHCVLHGNVGHDEEFRTILIVDGIAQSKTIETAWVGEYGAGFRQVATSETARLMRMPSLTSLELSHAHWHFAAKGLAAKTNRLKQLTLHNPWNGTGAELFPRALANNRILQRLELHLPGTDHAVRYGTLFEDIVHEALHLDELCIVIRSDDPPLKQVHLDRLTDRLIQNGRIQVECVQLHCERGDNLPLDAGTRAADNNLRVQSALNKAGRRRLQAQPGDCNHWVNAMTSLAQESGSLHCTQCYFFFFKMNPDMLSKISRAQKSPG